MPRFLTLWLPRFPVQRRLLADPALRSVPVFVVRRQPRGVMTVACWAWAEPPARGRGGERGGTVPGSIDPGMPLAEALAVLAMLHGRRACERAWIDHDDPEADRTALLDIARWCRRFTPAVAVETCLPGVRSECLCLDVTATASFFGGEERLVRTATWTLAARGTHARGANADTIGVAWAAAHHVDLAAAATVPEERGGERRAAGDGEGRSGPGKSGGPDGKQSRRRRHVVVPPGGQAGLGALPAGSLRLDDDTLVRLREVGVDTVGGVTRLPRRSLASRFGPLLVRRLAEWTGERAEPLDVARDGQLPHAERRFDFPLSLRGATEDLLVGCVGELLGECVRPLAAAGLGVTAFQVRFERPAGGGMAVGGDGAAPAATPPVVVDVGLFRPSAAVRHLAELVRLRLSRTRLPAELEGVSVEVMAAGPVTSRQRSLFGEEGMSAESQVEQLFDRLSGRLGRAAVFEPRAVADAQPEHAWIAVPPCLQPWEGARRRPDDPADTFGPRSSSPGPSGREAWRRSPATAERRPLELLPRPVRLETARLETARLETARPPCGTAVRASQAPVPAWIRAPDSIRAPAAWRDGGGTRDRRDGDAPIRRVVCAQGPERIETAWWRGPCVRRDYFVVECVADTGGDGVERWWIFRRLRDGAWFLHGIFS